MKSKLHRNKQFILASLIFSIFGTGAAFALPYTPTDQELDPSCAPGATDCYVEITSLPTQTGNTNRLLFTDGSDAAWASGLYWDETNDRLGVGVNTPADTLDIRGTANFYNAQTAGTGSDFFFVDINPNLSAGADNQSIALLRLRERSSSNGVFTGVKRLAIGVENPGGGQYPFQLFTSGQIRIGGSSIANPTDGLEVIGSTRSTTYTGKIDLIADSLTAALATSALNIAQTWNTSGTPTALKLNITDTASNANSLLLDLQVGGVSKFKVDKVGNVTSGTWSSSGSITEITGGTYQYTILRLSDAAGTIKLGDLDENSGEGTEFGINVGDYSAYIKNTGTPASKLGINTDIPGKHLDVVGEVRARPGIGGISGNFNAYEAAGTFLPSSGTSTFTGFNFTSTINQTGGANGITRGLYINPTLTSAADFRAIETVRGNIFLGTTSGVVSIANTNSSYTLEVGNNSVSGIVARFVNSTGTCDINPTTTSLSCSSDLTLKKNITDLDSSLSLLTQLRTVTYNWNTQDDNTTKTPGFIAQEVEQVFPFLVTTDPTTNLKSLNYTLFTPYIIKSIQEINANFTSLDASKENTLGYLIKKFLEDSLNGVERAIFGEVQTKKLCLEDICLTRDQLESLLQNQNIQNLPAPQNNNPEENTSEESGQDNSDEQEESEETMPQNDTNINTGDSEDESESNTSSENPEE